MTATPVHAADEILLAFARALRAAGVNVTADRERTYLDAVEAVGLGDELGAYRAGRATLCASPADLERYDQVYAAWFGLECAGTRRRRDATHTVAQAPLDTGRGRGEDAESPEDVVRAQASAVEVLRHRDVASLSSAERARLTAMFAALRPRAPRRPAHRHTPSRRGGCCPVPSPVREPA
jgi:uncharacterized protein with von Willebrand factor type A (vWA) domain